MIGLSPFSETAGRVPARRDTTIDPIEALRVEQASDLVMSKEGNLWC